MMYKISIIDDSWEGEATVAELRGIEISKLTLEQLEDWLDTTCQVHGDADYADLASDRLVASYDAWGGKWKKEHVAGRQISQADFKKILDLVYGDKRFSVQVDGDALQTSHYFTCRKGSAKGILTKCDIDNTYYIS